MRPFSIFLLVFCFFCGAGKATAEAGPGNNPFQTKFGKGLSFKTHDENFKASLGGLLQVDGILLNTNDTLIADQSGVRRGRLTLGMQLYRDWDLRATYDFTADQFDVRGFQLFFLRYKGARRTHFKIGNLQELIGLDWLTSSRNAVFMERAQMTSLIPPLHLGFVANTVGNSWALSTGIFGDRPVDGIHSGNSWGASSRLTYTPIRNRKTVLHFGMSGAYREQGERTSSAQTSLINTQRNFNAESTRFSSIGGVRDYNEIINTELAVRNGPFSMQFEYLRMFRNKPQLAQDFEDSEFDSWYIQGSWILTGEIRKYRARSGTFGHVKPKKKFNLKGGIGAWEIAARYSALNRLKSSDALGENESNVTLGINWYPHRHVRIMANYIRVESDFSQKNFMMPEKQSSNIFAMRAQIEF